MYDIEFSNIGELGGGFFRPDSRVLLRRRGVKCCKDISAFSEQFLIPDDAAACSFFTPRAFESRWGKLSSCNIGERFNCNFCLLFNSDVLREFANSGDENLGRWAKRNGLSIYFYTPSLARSVSEDDPDTPSYPGDLISAMAFPIPHIKKKSEDRKRVYAVGITTTQRRKETLTRTTSSLNLAGWNYFVIFVDGNSSVPENSVTTTRQRTTGGWQNWFLSLTELYVSNPQSSHILLCQDDVVFARYVRAYLENVHFPRDAGLLSLYTPHGYESNEYGFQPVNRGRQLVGACAWIIPRHVAKEIITDADLIDRKSRHCLDNAIGGWMNKRGYKVYYHSPSLAQHIGETSVMHPGLSASLDHNHSRMAPTFVGEDFDCTQGEWPQNNRVEITTPRQKVDSGIGVVGYNTAQGLGYLNRDLVRHLPADKWLIPAHRVPHLDSLECTQSIFCDGNAGQEVREFLSNLSVVVFAELMPVSGFFEAAKECGVKTACVPMHEWLDPGASWVKSVDLWIAPNEYCYRFLHQHFPANRIHLFPWPVDTERFSFRRRDRVRSYLFVHGNRGSKGRKGGDIVARAAEMCPEIPLIVYEQQYRGHGASNVRWPQHVNFMGEASCPEQLYAHGDVLLFPSRWEGIGLQALEAQACGMPLICTDAPPMSEYNHLDKIPCVYRSERLARTIQAAESDAEALAGLMRHWHRRDISEASVQARAWAERRSWAKQAPRLRDIITS